LLDEPSPLPFKALLVHGGECANELRPPMTPASQALAAGLAKIRDEQPERA